MLLSSIYSFPKSADVTAHMFRAVAKVISSRIQRLRSPDERLRNCSAVSVRSGALLGWTIQDQKTMLPNFRVNTLALTDNHASGFAGTEAVAGMFS